MGFRETHSSADGDSTQTMLTEAQGEVLRVRRESLIGVVLRGRYYLMHLLGKGGMGTVMEAYDRELHRQIAIKIIDQGVLRSRKADQRLAIEARALARLSHPNVVQIYDADTSEFSHRVFIAMELIDGLSLRRLIKEKKITPTECLRYLISAGKGLAAAHEQGVLHRDFKPGNVMIGKDGRVRVIDFGLACERPLEDELRDSQGGNERRSSSSLSPSRLTIQGATMGTPSYMAPEQHEGRKLDARTDQFAFCVTLYEALTDQMPFGKGNSTYLLSRMRSGDITPIPKGLNLPNGLKEALLRGLSYNPDERWPSMDALLDELERIITPKTRTWLKYILGGVASAGIMFGTQSMVEKSESDASLLTSDEPEEDEVELSCADQAMNQMGAVWNDEVRFQFEAIYENAQSQLDGIILYPHINNVPQEWPTPETFDAYAYQWQRAYVTVCEDENLSSFAIDRFMHCLSVRKMVFESNLDRFIHPNQTDLPGDFNRIYFPPIKPCIPPLNVSKPAKGYRSISRF